MRCRERYGGGYQLSQSTLKRCSTVPMFTRLCAGGAAKKAAKPPQPKKKNSGSESEKKKASNTEKKKPPPPKKSDPYYEMETENLNVSFVHNISLYYHRTGLRKKSCVKQEETTTASARAGHVYVETNHSY